MSVRIIAEVGSCHEGRKDYGFDLIEKCAGMGVDAVKFQLFPNEPKYTDCGNVYLQRGLFLEFMNHAKKNNIECSASVFDEDSFEWLLRQQPSFIKFSFSQKHQRAWIDETIHQRIEAITSCDVMSIDDVPRASTKLFCVSQYPVMWQIAFDEIFPRFDGFSDHTLGYGQTLEAVSLGASIIEKHLSHPAASCPDSRFALYPGEFAAMVVGIRQLEG